MSIAEVVARAPRLYSAGALFYEWLTTHGLQARAIAALSEALPQSGRLLDVCCGPGVILERVLRADPSRTGVGLDAAAGALERARRRGVEVVEGDAEHMPFDDQSFDAAYISGALYLLPRPVEVLKEMRRVSRSRVVVLEASPRLRARLALDPRSGLKLTERIDIAIWNAAMWAARRYSEESLAAELEAAGLKEARSRSAVDGLYLIASGECG